MAKTRSRGFRLFGLGTGALLTILIGAGAFIWFVKPEWKDKIVAMFKGNTPPTQ